MHMGVNSENGANAGHAAVIMVAHAKLLGAHVLGFSLDQLFIKPAGKTAALKSAMRKQQQKAARN